MKPTDEKDKEERKLKKIKIGLMREPRFALWSGLMMIGKTSIDDNIPTAATNGRDDIYGVSSSSNSMSVSLRSSCCTRHCTRRIDT